jgi:hypothetical protein
VPELPALRRRRRRATPRQEAAVVRGPAYYRVAGVALDAELEWLCGLPVFAAGPLAERRPQLKVRRARTRPNRVGFAVPAQFRVSVTAYPGIRPGDVLETLLHELVHLHVGRAPEARAWHGATFKRTLAAAMAEAYGVDIPPPPSSLHGAYAAAIERLLASD